MTDLRPATPDDVDEIVRLYTAYDLVEMGEAEVDAADVRAMLASENGEPQVLERDGRVVAYADLGATGEAETIVDLDLPDAADVQRDLLDWVLDRARDRGIARLEHWAGAREDGAAVLLADAGYAHARTLWKMARPLAGRLPGPVWPAGVEVLPFDPERDGRTVWELVQRGFAGGFGSHQRPFDDWALYALAGDDKDAVQAVEDGVLIGVATRSVRGGDGHVPQLTVDPAQRGRGLALALLHEAFRRDAADGRPATTLTVDGENANARRLYDKAGMAVAGEYRRWERAV